MKEEIGKIYHRLTIVREMEKHIYPSGDSWSSVTGIIKKIH